jgi:hypothetical protein
VNDMSNERHDRDLGQDISKENKNVTHMAWENKNEMNDREGKNTTNAWHGKEDMRQENISNGITAEKQRIMGRSRN